MTERSLSVLHTYTVNFRVYTLLVQACMHMLIAPLLDWVLPCVMPSRHGGGVTGGPGACGTYHHVHHVTCIPVQYWYAAVALPRQWH